MKNKKEQETQRAKDKELIKFCNTILFSLSAVIFTIIMSNLIFELIK
jgi:hypothetical protein